jgi:O-antigen biosynthesis protein WbqV
MKLLSGDGGGAPDGSAQRAILLGSAADIRDVVRRGRANASLEVRFVAAAPKEAAGATIAGLPVVAAASEFMRGDAMAVHANLLVLATRPTSREASRRLLDRSLRMGLAVRVAEMRGENGLVLRPMTLNDMIGAPIGATDWARVRAVMAGKRILVTGGAGSIGGELSRRIATLEPAHLSIIDNSELNLFQLESDLADHRDLASRSLRYCDVRDADAVRRAILAEKPDIVFHAAAMKHVPLVEENACEGVLTNVLGGRNVADAAGRLGAHLVFVSTDKAANPVSVMGATKRLVELYLQALDRSAPSGGPRRLTARLGNVLGSAGSVAPLFERQIGAGGPLTVTDPEVVRFFITIEQSADFLLQATAVGLDMDHVRGAVHVLEMGEPLRVVDLARDMIRLHGLEPDRDVSISFVGLRPGEKLREELTADDEWVEATISPGVKAVDSPPVSLPDVLRRLDRVITAARAGADDVVRAVVHDMVATKRDERARAAS